MPARVITPVAKRQPSRTSAASSAASRTAAGDRRDGPAQERGADSANAIPHTLRRTYITFMVAAGYDLPYIQAQVGHEDPTTTLAIYAQVMRRADRDQLRAEIRELLGVDDPVAPNARTAQEATAIRPALNRLRTVETAGKGRRLQP